MDPFLQYEYMSKCKLSLGIAIEQNAQNCFHCLRLPIRSWLGVERFHYLWTHKLFSYNCSF